MHAAFPLLNSLHYPHDLLCTRGTCCAGSGKAHYLRFRVRFRRLTVVGWRCCRRRRYYRVLRPLTYIPERRPPLRAFPWSTVCVGRAGVTGCILVDDRTEQPTRQGGWW